MLENFETGQRIPAASIPDLFPINPMGGATGYERPSIPAQYPRYDANFDNGSKELTWSFIWTAMGYVCCPIICPALGYYYANLAQAKGNPSAQGARIFAIVTLILEGVFVLFYIVILIVMIGAAASAPR